MNQIDLKGRTAVVTGGAQGIGFSIASRLIASGATLSLWDRDEAPLNKAQADCSALAVKCLSKLWTSPRPKV
jgi:3-oxoacyl-[acyl-carrier protein] reductase